MKSKQDPVDYADKAQRLAELHELARQGHIDLFFGDEAGFSLNLNPPYGRFGGPMAVPWGTDSDFAPDGQAAQCIGLYEGVG